MKMRKLINEKWIQDHISGDEFKVTREERDAFLENVRNFNSFKKSIYRENNIKELTENLRKLVEYATQFTVHESGDWFDSVTVKRHMKKLQEDFKVFESTAKEMYTLQQRLENCYEDIGTTLNKYYEIKEEEEERIEQEKDDSDVEDNMTRMNESDVPGDVEKKYVGKRVKVIRSSGNPLDLNITGTVEKVTKSHKGYLAVIVSDRHKEKHYALVDNLKVLD